MTFRSDPKFKKKFNGTPIRLTMSKKSPKNKSENYFNYQYQFSNRKTMISHSSMIRKVCKGHCKSDSKFRNEGPFETTSLVTKFSQL